MKQYPREFASWKPSGSTLKKEIWSTPTTDPGLWPWSSTLTEWMACLLPHRHMEALKLLVSDAATVDSIARNSSKEEKAVMVNDVARAFFEAPISREAAVELPAGGRWGARKWNGCSSSEIPSRDKRRCSEFPKGSQETHEGAGTSRGSLQRKHFLPSATWIARDVLRWRFHLNWEQGIFPPKRWGTWRQSFEQSYSSIFCWMGIWRRPKARRACGGCHGFKSQRTQSPHQEKMRRRRRRRRRVGCWRRTRPQCSGS